MALGSAALQRLQVSLSLQDRLSGPLRNIEKGITGFAAKASAATANVASGMIALTGAAAGLERLVAPFLEQERALAELSTLDLGADALARLDKMSRRVQSRFGADATAIVRSAYDIQSAIAGLTPKELVRVTELGAAMSKGLRATPQEVTGFMATMFGIFEKEANRIGKKAWFDRLGGMAATATQMFRTDAAKLSASFENLGAAGAAANVPLAEQITVLGKLSAVMKSGERAGTQYRAFLAQIGPAQKKLGMSFTDAANRLLPVTGILDRLRARFGDTLDTAERVKLREALGGDEALGFVTVMYDKVGELRQGIAALEKVHGADKAFGMAKKATTAFDRFQGALKTLRLTFGSTVLPTLNPLLEKASAFLARVDAWRAAFPALARALGQGTLALFGFTALVGAAGIALGVFRFATLGMGVPLKGLYRSVVFLFNPLATMRRGFAALTTAVRASTLYVNAHGAALRLKAGALRLYAGALWLWRRRTMLATAATWTGTRALAAWRRANLASRAATLASLLGTLLWRGVMLTWKGVMLGATAALWLFNAALWANPTTWVVVGVLALIGAIALAIVYWERIKAAAVGFVTWVREHFTVHAVIAHWETLKGWFTDFWDWLTSGFRRAIDTIAGWFKGLPGRIAETFRRLAGPQTWMGKALGVFGIKIGASGQTGEGLARQATRAEPPPAALHQAAANLAGADNRRQVIITQHIRTEKYDPAAFERGLFALGLR